MLDPQKLQVLWDVLSRAPATRAEQIVCQQVIDELLTLSSIGVRLTEEYQLDPEQSTSAIIVPHPEAKYFVV